MWITSLISTKTAAYLEGLPASNDSKLNDTFLESFDHQWHCQRSFYTLHTCVFPAFLNTMNRYHNHNCKQQYENIPLRSKDTRPFQVNAVRITAGQKGATLSDQSAHLISYKTHIYVFKGFCAVLFYLFSSYKLIKFRDCNKTFSYMFWNSKANTNLL